MLSILKLFLIFIITIGPYYVCANSDTLTTFELETVVIHENRIIRTFSEASRNIHVTSRKDISSFPVQNLPEILLYTPGVDIRQRGPGGVQADLGIRGGTFEQSLILINGIKLSDPQTGHHTMNIPVHMLDIDQVEVVKGPGARIYGQNAFNGAINIITRPPGEKYLKARILGGDFGFWGGTLSLSTPIKKLRQTFTLSREFSGGYRENTDFRISNFLYQAESPLMGGTLSLLGGYVTRKFGANGFYAGPQFTRQYEEIQTGLIHVAFEKNSGNFSLTPRIYWRINEDNYFFVRENPEIYENLHLTHAGGAELNASYRSGLGSTGIGIESRTEIINGNWVRNGREQRSNLDGFSRQNFGFYLEHHFRKDRFDFTPGIYLGYYDTFGWNFFPGADAGILVGKNLRLYANVGTSFRVPTFYELYYESPVESGNPDLVPEEAFSYEFGCRIFKRLYNLEMNIFHQSGDNLIDWLYIPITDSTYRWQAQNMTRLNRTGFEFGMNFELMKLLPGQSILHQASISYNYLWSELADNEFDSRYVLENLKQQMILGLDHGIIWKITHHMNIRMSEREGQSGYWLFDSRLAWSQDESMLFMEITNITDRKYVEVMTPMPGRWFRAGFIYKLNF